MVGLHKMLRHLIWRSRGLTLTVASGMSLFSLAIAPAFSQAPRVPAASTVAPSRVLLKTGSQGTEVVELQGVLKLLGYYTGSMSGSFDQPTAIAVTKFQQAAGLPTDGVVGSETWNRLLPPSPTVTAAAPKPADSPAAPSSQTTPSKPVQPPATSTPPAKSAATKLPVPNEAAAKQESATLPILRIGMQGSAVTGLQERLRALGFLKSSADGVFGAETQAAVKAAQTKFSLTSDGVVGTTTWLALMR